MIISNTNLKFKKIHKKKKSFLCIKNLSPQKKSQGFYIIKVFDYFRITSKHLDILKKEFVKIARKQGKLWFSILPNIPITKKNEKSRMGKGVGKFSHNVFYMYPGQILLELEALDNSLVLMLFKRWKTLLPTKLVLIAI